MKKNKLFLLLGKSSSGKSVTEKEIDKLGYAKKIISMTTREAREYEIDTVDYYFISQEIFDIYLKQNQFAEHSTYPTVWGDASYGINKNDIKLDEFNGIAVVNPDGHRQLLKSLGKENIVSIYIERDDRERVVSAIERDKSKDLRKLLREIDRRLEADEIDFKGIADEVNYKIKNIDLEQTIQQVINIIKVETGE